MQKLSKGIFIEAYGLTETSPITHMNPPKGIQKIESIGIPLPNTLCKIVDIQTNQECPPNQIGELLISGPQVFKGYWNRSNASNEDKWFHTKDMAMMDNDGYFYIKGRLDDMINVRGEKAWPQDIEDVLKEYPLISDAAVIGIPSEYYGQMPKAFIVAKEEIEKEKIIDFCKEHLADYQIPREIEFISEIPKSPLGKILHYKLK
jgi:long-chain acyl-CoA synthetase